MAHTQPAFDASKTTLTEVIIEYERKPFMFEDLEKNPEGFAVLPAHKEPRRHIRRLLFVLFTILSVALTMGLIGTMGWVIFKMSRKLTMPKAEGEHALITMNDILRVQSGGKEERGCP